MKLAQSRKGWSCWAQRSSDSSVRWAMKWVLVASGGTGAGQATVVFGVQVFYRIFIPLVLGGMVLYVVAHQIRRTIDRRRAREHG